MSYTPTEWKAGDVITSEGLNHMEQGIAGAGGGASVLIVHDNEDTLDKTWQEMHDAAPLVCLENEGAYSPLCLAGEHEGVYGIAFFDYQTGQESNPYVTDSASGYPATNK